jgi:hypothetical protein
MNFARDLQERLGILAPLALSAPFRICKLQIPLAAAETDPVSGHHISDRHRESHEKPHNCSSTRLPSARPLDRNCWPQSIDAVAPCCTESFVPGARSDRGITVRPPASVARLARSRLGCTPGLRFGIGGLGCDRGGYHRRWFPQAE